MLIRRLMDILAHAGSAGSDTVWRSPMRADCRPRGHFRASTGLRRLQRGGVLHQQPQARLRGRVGGIIPAAGEKIP